MLLSQGWRGPRGSYLSSDGSRNGGWSSLSASSPSSWEGDGGNEGEEHLLSDWWRMTSLLHGKLETQFTVGFLHVNLDFQMREENFHIRFQTASHFRFILPFPPLLPPPPPHTLTRTHTHSRHVHPHTLSPTFSLWAPPPYGARSLFSNKAPGWPQEVGGYPGLRAVCYSNHLLDLKFDWPNWIK